MVVLVLVGRRGDWFDTSKNFEEVLIFLQDFPFAIFARFLDFVYDCLADFPQVGFRFLFV